MASASPWMGSNGGLTDLGEAAHKIATASSEGDQISELSGALVDALEAQRQIEASANVVRRIDQTLGTLIDTFA